MKARYTNSRTAIDRRPRIIIYGRVSTDDQAENGISLVQQEFLVRKVLDSTYGTGNYEVVGYEKDAGMSGSLGPTAQDIGQDGKIRPRTKHRLGLLRIYEAILKGEADVVAAYSMSRFYRHGSATFGFIEFMLAHGAKIFTVQERTDIETPSGRLMAGVVGLAASFQRESSNDNVRDILNRRKEQGLWQGTAPYGWRFPTAAEVEAGALKTLLPVPAQIDVIKEIARLYLSGHSERKIARELNARGVLRQNKKRGPRNSKDVRWNNVNVGLVLVNVANAGLIRLADETLIEGKHYEHRAYDPETYEEIQRVLAERRTKFRGVKNERPEMLLSGLVTCGACGAKLGVRFTNDLRCYTCRGQRSEAGTKHVWVNAETFEKSVIHHIGKLAQDPEIRRAAEARIMVEANAGYEESRKELEQLRSRQAELQAQMKTALEHLRAGYLTPDLFKLQTEAIRSDQATVDDRTRELETLLSSSVQTEEIKQKALEALGSFNLLWQHLEPVERTELLRAAIESLVVIDEGDSATMILKLHLLPEIRQLLPRVNAPRGKVTKGGPESLTLPELACLWHLMHGKKAVDAAAAMGITESTFSTMVKRAKERLNAEDVKEAIRKSQNWVREIEHALPLTGARRKRRHKKTDLTAIEAAAIQYRDKGFSLQQLADQFQVSVERVQAVLKAADQKLASR